MTSTYLGFDAPPDDDAIEPPRRTVLAAPIVAGCSLWLPAFLWLWLG